MRASTGSKWQDLMPELRRVSIQYADLYEVARAVRTDNPKRHDVEAIIESILRAGFVTPTIQNDEDGTMLVGAGRIEALLALHARGAEAPSGIAVDSDGRWLVPVVHGVHLTASAASAFLLADNRTTELGGWDDQQLGALLQELATTTEGLQGTGFTETDLSALLDRLAAVEPIPIDPDVPPSMPIDSEIYVRSGDVWALGSHVVSVSDATDRRSFESLLGGEPADLSLADPPYNVDYGNHGGQAALGRAPRRIENDHLSPEAWRTFVQAWAQNLVKFTDGALYVFMSSREWPVLAAVLQAAGAHWSDTLIWAKDHFVLGRADYQRQYEPIWYGWRDGSTHHWCGDRDQSDVWFVPRPQASDLHPMMKPVSLLERAITNSSKRGGRILDPFLGSGSTLIAAERTGRSCLGIEIDPRYAQATLERWKQYTGKEPLLLARQH